MAIKNIKERLEGSYRLIRIRRIKTSFFLIQLIISLVLGLLVSYIARMKWEPFYFPIGLFTFTFLILVLIMSGEAIYFKGMEIKYTRNKSRRYLLARNSIRRSILIIAVSGLLILMMLLPQTHDAILDTHVPGGSGLTVGMMNSTSQSFMSQDRFGLAMVSSLTFNANGDCGISVVKNGVPIWSPDTAAPSFNWTGLGAFAAPVDDIVLYVDNQNPVPVTYSYSVGSEVSPFITLYLPAMGLAFIIIQLISVSIMYPIRERYASSSIYSKKYVARTETGEYRISERAVTKEEQEELDILDSTLDTDIPMPESISVRPPPPERVEMARARGRVDDDLIEEPDIACPKCGELNGAHSALCFSCGAELPASEKKTIDAETYISKGADFARAGKYDDAISCYDEVLRYERGHTAALVGKGQALHSMGKWGSAVQYVNTALKLNPENVDALLLKAGILEDRDRLDKSMEIYSQILSIDPDNSIARSKMEQVSEEAALENVEDVLEQFMCLPGIGLARATALYDGGFMSMESLKSATEDELAGVKGISKGLAKKIKKNLEMQ